VFYCRKSYKAVPNPSIREVTSTVLRHTQEEHSEIWQTPLHFCVILWEDGVQIVRTIFVILRCLLGNFLKCEFGLAEVSRLFFCVSNRAILGSITL